MKRFLLLVLLAVPAVHAADDSETIRETWNRISSYRAASGVKAGVTFILGVYAFHIGWDHAFSGERSFAYHMKNLDIHHDRKRQFKSLFWEGVGAGGMFYTSYQLLWNYFRPYAKHALAIK